VQSHQSFVILGAAIGEIQRRCSGDIAEISYVSFFSLPFLYLPGSPCRRGGRPRSQEDLSPHISPYLPISPHISLGAAGDLAAKKTFPSLFKLYLGRYLPHNLAPPLIRPLTLALALALTPAPTPTAPYPKPKP